MKKILISTILTVLLISCSSSDDTSSNNSSPYSPPAWIHGTWGLKAGVGVPNDMAFYKFTTDNVCQLINGISSMCWKESIQQTPTILSGSDSSTPTTYIANFISGNGAQTTTLSFQKVSATKILWLNTSSGNIELEKLD